MTAPENNSCCATDLAPMSGPGAFGVGIIGIVSYEPAAPATRIQTSYPFGHIYRSVLNSGRKWVNPLLGRRRGFVAPIYRNLPFACCEIDEQKGSASET